ncbi:MAG: hypothetical protein K9J30_10330 [Bacteroidales bacterium]|nr:hypothetical protein [Bacteroidales bacterium]
MPIEDFNGETFVAFTDISGFKELMRSDAVALEAIRHFYQIGFNILREQNNVEGFFVSDCGILFSRNGTIENKLLTLLNAIKLINQQMIEYNYMLTTSIAYGRFDFQGKIEFQGIEKNPIYGEAYVQAFLDNETGKPKIQPGQCRIIRQNLPDLNFENITLLSERDRDNKHLYYYWNLNSIDELDEFERKYNDSYTLKFAGMLNALKHL